LTARALGAEQVIVSDTHDRQIAETVNHVTEQFGGAFKVEMGRSWRSVINEWKSSGGRVVHLTVYGIPLPKVVKKIRDSSGDKLVVVGAEKVPGELYRMADWNVAVTNQPISEVSALGIFLDWYFGHRRLQDEFEDARIRIVPTEHGKRVEGL
jgi:tRNA (cytidine56-2'-O)-methyltransferase